MDIKQNTLPANPIYGTPRKSYKKGGIERKSEGEKGYESVKGKKKRVGKAKCFQQ
jgi:hypothetical protein